MTARIARTPHVGDFPIAWTPALRARYRRLCRYFPWLATVNEAYQFRMATTSLYRPAFVFGQGRASNDQQRAPWRDLSPARIAAWRAQDLAARWATSDRTAAALAWLEDEFGGGSEAA